MKRTEDGITEERQVSVAHPSGSINYWVDIGHLSIRLSREELVRLVALGTQMIKSEEVMTAGNTPKS